MIVPILSKLSMQLESIEWAAKTDFSSGQLVSLPVITILAPVNFIKWSN